jgi:pimeloyl-ACP methyl ester carboxylesterase
MAKGQRIYERHGKSIYFKNDDMDFSLQWMLGYHTYGGLSVGEGFYIASRIKDGNVEDWRNEFSNYGIVQEKLATDLISNGNKKAASKRLMCAFNAYRAAAMFVSPKTSDFQELVARFEATFQESMVCSQLSIEKIEVPFENKRLPGYFYRSPNHTQSTPLIIIVGGSDSFREDLYFFGGAEAIMRGYNVAMIDLPGQGNTPSHGLYFRHDMEKPMTSIIDWISSEKHTNVNRVGVYGVSGGGYFALRAAAHERRIKALALSTPIYDMYSVITKQIPKILVQLSKFDKLLAFLDKPASVGVEKYFWQTGLDNYADILEKLVSKMAVDVETVGCPVLAICGTGESEEIKRQSREFFDKLKTKFSQTKYIEYSAQDGADAHCQVNNFQLAHQELFDWFEGVFSNNKE